MAEIDDLAEIEEQEKKKKRVLCSLLDERGREEKKYFAIRGNMGCIRLVGGRSISIPSYSVMHSLNWVALRNVLMGSEMDFMKNSIDPETGKLVIDEETAEEMKQRAPDWSRQAQLTTYLIQDDYRKFGTILAVISPDWIDDPYHENWGKDGRAVKAAEAFQPMDSEGNVGLLDLDYVKVYALDGQHRVMGIRGVLDVQEGALSIRNRAGEEKKRMPKDDLLKKIHCDAADLNRVLAEKINIEYIPAVLTGETRQEASRRIRSVFVAINSYAKTPDKGENFLLNENDGFAIVARHVAHHRLFRTNEGGTRVNWKNTSIAASDETNITTLGSLTEAVRESWDDEYDWAPVFQGMVPARPREVEINELTRKVNQVLDAVSSLPVFKRVRAGDELKQLRDFPTEKQPDPEGHLLLRPIGFPILLRAIQRAVRDNGDLTLVVKKLEVLDERGGFKAHDPSSIFFGVTFDPVKAKMITSASAKNLAVDLLVYLLNGAKAEEREDLAKKAAESRIISNEKWQDFNGTEKSRSNLFASLPSPVAV